jgi:hypothetical protein
MNVNRWTLGLIGAGAVAMASAQPANSNVAWSQDRDNQGVIVHGLVEAGKAIADATLTHHPVVRFSSNGAGGTALVPLWAYSPGSRCSPNFDLAPFDVTAGEEVWADFEFVNIKPSDQALIAFAIKADKPGRSDRSRLDHDVGTGNVGNRPSMSGPLATPTSGDYAYYFLDRGYITTDEILRRNLGAAIRITISGHLDRV